MDGWNVPNQAQPWIYHKNHANIAGRFGASGIKKQKMDQPFIEGGCFRNTNPKVLRDNNMRILVDIEQCSKTRSNSLDKICSS